MNSLICIVQPHSSLKHTFFKTFSEKNETLLKTNPFKDQFIGNDTFY